MVIDIENVINFVRDYNEEYELLYGLDDIGCCGFANVLINFGRKTKLRKQLEEQGFIDSCPWDIYGKKYYMVNHIRVENDIPVQTYEYHEGRAKVIATEIARQLDDPTIDVYARAYVD